jgi:hypothetical protein
VTERTRRAPSSTTTAIRTLLRKPQPAAGSLNLSCAFAGRTNHHWSTNITGAIAARALLRTIDRDVCRQSFNRFFEREAQRHLDVCASLWLRSRRLLFFRGATTKQVSEDVAKTAASSTA